MRSKFLFLNILALFLFAVSSLGSEKLQKISVQLEWKHQFEFAGFYAAIEKGYYKDIGLEVELKEFVDGVNISEDVLNGKSTFGISSSALVLEKLHHKPVVLLSSFFKQNALALVTQANIKSVDQLKGKKVMAVDWEIGHTSLGVMFQDYGLDRDDFTLVPHDYKVDKFINGEVDAMSVFLTSQPYELNKAGIPYNVINPANYGIFSYDVELFTSENYIRQNPLLVHNFIEATNKGWEYAFAHKSEIIDLIYEKYTKRKSKESLIFEANETEKFFKTHIFKIGSVVPELIKLNIDMYEKLGVVDTNYKIFDIFNEYLYKSENFPLERLSLSDEEFQYIQTNPVVNIAMLHNFKPFSYSENGFTQGLSHDILEEITKLTGLKFYKHIDDWSKSLEKFKNKQVEMISGISHTQEREEFTLFSEPFFEIPVYVFGAKGDLHYKNIQSLIGKRVGITKDLFYQEDLKKLGLKVVEYESNDAKVDAFVLNKIDYFLASYTSGKKAITQKAITNLEPLGLIEEVKKEDLRYGIVKENPLLHSIIEKALKHIKNTQYEKIINKWIINLDKIEREKKDILNFILTQEEQEYLKNKAKITYCIDPSWMPFESLEKGKHKGISYDYVKIFSDALNIPFELVPTTSWSQTMEYGKNKQCDILSFLVMETPQRKENFLFTTPYLHVPLVIATRNDVTFVTNFESLGDKKVAIPKEYAFYDILKKKYPTINLIEVENADEGLRKVRDKEYYGFIGTLASVGYLFQTKFMGELKIAGKFDETWELAIGLNKEEKLLQEIVQKVLNAISQTEHQEIFNKWVAIKYENRIDYELLWEVILFSLIILLIFIYWNRKLRILNSELEYQKNKAQELLHIKSNFLANITHEIRTPMNVILGMTYLIKKSSVDNKEQEQLSNIERATNSLLRLINDILDSSKIEAGKLKIVKSNFNLLILIEAIRTVALTNIEGREIDFLVEYDKNLSTDFYGDSLRLEQILTNLVSNATKFTKKGSVKLLIENSKHNQYRFCIEDTGIGISKAQIKNVFEPFTQADDTITREYGGTGLGLSICKQLVELLGGNLEIESSLGKGTKICFDIELLESTEHIEMVKESPITPSFGIAMNILKSQTKVKIDLQKEEKLLYELKQAVARKRPKLILPFIDELEKYELNILQKEDFHSLKIFIKKYMFSEAKELLERYEK